MRVSESRRETYWDVLAPPVPLATLRRALGDRSLPFENTARRRDRLRNAVEGVAAERLANLVA